MKFEDLTIRTSHLNTNIGHLIKILNNNMIQYKESVVNDDMIKQMRQLLDINIQLIIRLIPFEGKAEISESLSYLSIDGDRAISIIKHISDNLIGQDKINFESKSIILCFIHIFKNSVPLKSKYIMGVQEYLKNTLNVVR